MSARHARFPAIRLCMKFQHIWSCREGTTIRARYHRVHSSADVRGSARLTARARALLFPERQEKNVTAAPRACPYNVNTPTRAGYRRLRMPFGIRSLCIRMTLDNGQISHDPLLVAVGHVALGHSGNEAVYVLGVSSKCCILFLQRCVGVLFWSCTVLVVPAAVSCGCNV